LWVKTDIDFVPRIEPPFRCLKHPLNTVFQEFPVSPIRPKSGAKLAFTVPCCANQLFGQYCVQSGFWRGKYGTVATAFGAVQTRRKKSDNCHVEQFFVCERFDYLTKIRKVFHPRNTLANFFLFIFATFGPE